MHIEVYHENHKATWDSFVKDSKNGTFLFLRDYMDYHRSRLHDHSLMVWDDEGELVALLPCHAAADTITSHGGLTFGGFITGIAMKMPKMLEIFELVLTRFQQDAFTELVYKTVPHIYHLVPAEEDRYALFLCNAALIRRSVIATIDTRSRIPWQERRIRALRKAHKNNLSVRFCNELAVYWALLEAVLQKNFSAQPAHKLDEICLLRDRFPDCIKLCACFNATDMLAGVLIFESQQVARAQYIASSEVGRSLGALDLIFSFLLNEAYKDKLYFDFGTSDEHDGRFLNRGLIEQKEGFGARAVAHDQYRIDLAGWTPEQIKNAMEHH
jgi:hypothetical protein